MSARMILQRRRNVKRLGFEFENTYKTTAANTGIWQQGPEFELELTREEFYENMRNMKEHRAVGVLD